MQSATEFKALEIYPDGVYLVGALWRISNQGLNFLFFFSICQLDSQPIEQLFDL